MKTTRWGVMGTGAAAHYFAEGLRSVPGARIQAVGSRTPENAARFAHEHGAGRSHGSYEELVQSPDVDVVYVASPNACHKEHALLALRNDKPVLCEKPFATTAGDAREMVKLARARGLFCMEAMWSRFVPMGREVVDRVNRGDIGDVTLIIASLGFPYEIDPTRPQFDPALGGGATLDLGVYPLSLSFRILGRPIAATGRSLVGRSGIEEQATILLDFGQGRQAVVTASFRSRLSNDAVIYGTRGTLRLHEPLYCPEHATLVHTAEQSAARSQSRRFPRLRAFAHRSGLRDAYSSLRRARQRTPITRRCIGNGYAHEAMEVMRCLGDGARESPVMPLDESVAILETIDGLRAPWSREPAK